MYQRFRISTISLILTISLVLALAPLHVAVAAVPGRPANGASTEAGISSDGRYVVFTSSATNLVSDSDTNAATDVFVRDRTEGVTQLVSVRSSGGAGTGFSDSPYISSDGRYVAFRSSAEDLVSDGNGYYDIFVRDLSTGVTSIVSRSSSGAQANGTNRTPVLSADGRYVAYLSRATNLVAGDTNAKDDIFVHDRSTGATERVSVSSSGEQGNNTSNDPTISPDGRYVAFRSYASNLVSGDTNNWDDIFVRDRVGGQTFRVNVSSAGAQSDKYTHGRPWISDQGLFVAFTSDGTTLVPNDTNSAEDAFRRDVARGITERSSVSSQGEQANLDGSSDNSSITSDGRYVTFQSHAYNLVPGDNNGVEDIFVRDHSGSTTTRVSVDSSENEANGFSSIAQIAGGGGFIVFQSDASNLVSNDTNGTTDIFVRDLNVGTTERVSLGNNAAPVVSLSVSPTDGDATTVFTADMAGTNDPDGDAITSYKIEWGDGGVTNASSGTHSYTSRGTYTITATATDQWGASGSKTQSVNISNNPPNITFTVSPQHGDTNTIFSADLSGSDPDGDPITFEIDWGDGTVSDNASDQHQYSSTGEYEVTGTVADSVGGTAAQTVIVRVCLVSSDNCSASRPEGLSQNSVADSVEDTYAQQLHPVVGEYVATVIETYNQVGAGNEVDKTLSDQRDEVIDLAQTVVLNQVYEETRDEAAILKTKVDELDAAVQDGGGSGNDDVDKYVAGMTAKELGVCIYYWKDCAASAEAPEDARRWSANRYPKMSGQDDKRDAVRHCLWSALMTRRGSFDFAHDMGLAHEQHPGSKRGKMDLHNNSKGRLVGLEADQDRKGKFWMGDRCVVFADAGNLVISLDDPRVRK